MTPETSVKHQIKDYLRLRGWFTYHNLAGLGCYPGLSDIVAIKDGIVLWIECKAPSGRQSDHQKRFQSDVSEHGGHYVLAYGYEDIDAYLLSIQQIDEYDKQEVLI